MKLQKFCPKCGEKTEKLYNGLCNNCAKQAKELIIAPKKITVQLCECGRASIGGAWKVYENIVQLIEKTVLAKSVIEKNAEVSVSFEPITHIGQTTMPVTIFATDNGIEESKTLDFVLKNITCDTCSRKYGAYYEAIMQIRAKSEFAEKIHKFIKDEVQRNSKTNKLSFITQELNVLNGLDLYVGSSRLASKIAKSAASLYKLSIKTTYTHQGIKDGKNITRSTILLKKENDF
ncbi:hypothetical protein GQ473_07545 [archaeon]|nr:hypothetical protein [archaeon]